MNKKVLLVVMLFVTSLAFSQKLTVGQLITLSKTSLGEVEGLLTENNWFFYLGVDETEEAFGNAKFVYDRPDFKLGDAGQYFITYYYSEESSANAIEISFRNPAVYESFSEQLKNLKFILKYSRTENGNIIKVYKNGPNMIELTIPPNFETTNSYKFIFARSSSYKKFRK